MKKFLVLSVAVMFLFMSCKNKVCQDIIDDVNEEFNDTIIPDSCAVDGVSTNINNFNYYPIDKMNLCVDSDTAVCVACR